MFLIGHLTQVPPHLQARDHRQIMVDQVNCVRFYFSKMFTDRLKNVLIGICLLIGLFRGALSLRDNLVVEATLLTK